MGISSCHSSPSKDKYVKLGILFVVVLLAIVLLFLALGGTHTTTGNFPADVETKTLECISSKQAYDKLSWDTSSPAGSARIVGIFSGQGSLVKLSFEYSITYESQESLETEEPYLRANLAKNLDKDGLSFDEFENKFTIHQNTISLAIYAEPDDITEKSSAYFLLSSKDLPTNYLEFRSAYENQRFKCSSTSDD